MNRGSLQRHRLTSILLLNSNFGTIGDLANYIEELVSDTKNFKHIHLVFDGNTEELDLFYVGEYEDVEYHHKVLDVTDFLYKCFRHKGYRLTKENYKRLLNVIDESYAYYVKEVFK